MTLTCGSRSRPGSPSRDNQEDSRGSPKRYKAISLGILYGLTIYGAAMRLGISLDEARAIVDSTSASSSTYWEWSERVVQAAYDRGGSTPPAAGLRYPPQQFPDLAELADPGQRCRHHEADRDLPRPPERATAAPVHDGFLLTYTKTSFAISGLRSIKPVPKP